MTRETTAGRYWEAEMKKLYLTFIVMFVIAGVLQGCGAGEKTEHGSNSASVTEEMAYEGVYNYCRGAYDWSIAENDPDVMFLEMGEETDAEYQVIFRSYTGAYVYFYVDKSNGTTRLTEYVPILEIEEAAGTIDLYDYLD